MPEWFATPYKLYVQPGTLGAAKALRSKPVNGKSTITFSLLRNRSIGEKRFKSVMYFIKEIIKKIIQSYIWILKKNIKKTWINYYNVIVNQIEWTHCIFRLTSRLNYRKRIRITRIFGNFCMLKLFVHFLLIWHLEQVGFSSPSSTSSRVKCSKHWLNFTVPLLAGIGKLRSQKGSNVTDTWSQEVQCNDERNWPTKTSTIILSSLRK